MSKPLHHLVFFLPVVLAAPLAARAQIGIGTTTPHASAALEVSSASQGFLPPRLTYAQRMGISSPAAGLLVYQSNTNASPAAAPGYYYYTGSAWVPIQTQGDNLGTHTATTTLHLSNNPLNLRGTAAAPDANHGLTYSATPDGPRLFGFGGGMLGSGTTTTALRWDNAGRVRIGDGTAPGTDYVLDVNGDVGVRAANTLEFGAGVSGKEANAGKIAYNAFGSGALDIVGAGTNSTNRKIKLWAEGGTELAGPIKISGGSPGTGKVLTSDADGDATWQTPIAGLTAATNGLTATSGTVKLGGALTETTAITATTSTQQIRIETPPAASGPFTNSLDQQQTVNNTEEVFRDFDGTSSPATQTFTPAYTASLSEVRLLVRSRAFNVGASTSLTLRLEILPGVVGPTGGTPLANLTQALTNPDGNQLEVSFAAGGITLTAGQVYTLRVSGPADVNGTSQWLWRGATGNPYAGGVSSAGGTIDQWFRTFIQPTAGTGLRLRRGSTEVTGPMQVWGSVTAEDQLTVNGTLDAQEIIAEGDVRQRTYAQDFFGSGVGGASSATYNWTHNLGYRPVVMPVLDETGGSFSSRVNVTYEHLNNNTVQFHLYNSSLSTATFRLRWIVVGR